MPPSGLEEIAISQKHKILATHGDVFWDLFNGQERPALKGGSGSHAAFSSDGAFFYVDRQLWSMVSCKQEGVIADRSRYEQGTMATFSHSGKLLANGYNLWEVSPLRRRWSRPPGHSVYTTRVAFSPDDEFVLVTDDTGDFKFAKVDTGELVYSGRPHDRIAGLALSPDGRRAVTIPRYAKGPIKIWKSELRQQTGQ